MSNHIDMFSLDRPWVFPSWDNLKSSTPPWVHKGFWYHPGDGKIIVFVWGESFDESGYLCCYGHIYRSTNIHEALGILETYREDVRMGRYDGAFIFYGRRRPSTLILGKPFPELLPNGRW